MELLIDCHHGIYIPKLFVESYGHLIVNRKDVLWELGELGNTDNELYWEAWDDLLDKAVMPEGKVLYQNDDLWLATEEELESLS